MNQVDTARPFFESPPLQVWKTHMGRNRGQTTLGSLRAIYTEGGGGLSGVSAFWAGTGPKVSSLHPPMNDVMTTDEHIRAIILPVNAEGCIVLGTADV